MATNPRNIYFWDLYLPEIIGDPISRLSDPGLKQIKDPLSEKISTNLAFSPDGTIIAGGVGATIILWDIRTGLRRKTFINTSKIDPKVNLRTHPGTLSEIAFSPNGNIIAGTDRDSLQIWDVRSNLKLIDLYSNYHSGGIKTLAFSPNGKILAVDHRDKIDLWDVESVPPTIMITLNAPVEAQNPRTAKMYTTARWRPFAFSPDSKTFASTAAGKTPSRNFGFPPSTELIKLWDLEQLLAEFPIFNK